MSSQIGDERLNPVNVIAHFRQVNRQFDNTPEKVTDRLEACFTEQLRELGLFQRYPRVETEDTSEGAFDFVRPEAVRVIIAAFITGKLPQPEHRGSFFFTERTALGRQAALDTAIEWIKEQPHYQVAGDPDFYPETGDARG